jgi:hypothetical protein
MIIYTIQQMPLFKTRAATTVRNVNYLLTQPSTSFEQLMRSQEIQQLRPSGSHAFNSDLGNIFDFFFV